MHQHLITYHKLNEFFLGGEVDFFFINVGKLSFLTLFFFLFCRLNKRYLSINELIKLLF